MSRALAEADLQSILEDDVGGFAQPIRLTSPAGDTVDLMGNTTDIGMTLDPETGQPIVGRRASVVLSLRSIAAAGIGTPTVVSSSSSRPWQVSFPDHFEVEHLFKVADLMTDRAAGCVVLFVEAYET